jgi:molecular chaperone HscA
MALYQCRTRTQAAPTQHKWAVGIDLGTTNSLVAVGAQRQRENLADEHRAPMLPSVCTISAMGGAVAMRPGT